jgi:hypothetical protein
MPMHVEARTLGRAVNISLTYDGASPAMNDKVTVSGVKVEITQAPDYLFANARYAPPIRFRVEAGDEDPTFEEIEPLLASVRVSFYAANGDGSTEEHHRFTTANLAPTAEDPTGRICRVIDETNSEKLEVLGNGDSAQTNCYEVYVPSREFRGFQLDTPWGVDKHLTKWAHFEMEIMLRAGADAGQVTLESGARPSNPQPAIAPDGESVNNTGPCITQFADDTLPAWDIGIANGQYLRTAKSLTYVTKAPHQYTEEVHWTPGEGSVERKRNSRWVCDYWCDVNQENSRPKQREVTTTRTLHWHGHKRRIRHKKHYWNGVNLSTWPSYLVSAKPQVRAAYFDLGENEPTYLENDWLAPARHCFATCGVGSLCSGREYYSHVWVYQNPNARLYKGSYVTRSLGMRVGGYLYASYGPKTPPCLVGNRIAVGDVVTIGEIGEVTHLQEHAMNLKDQIGDAHIMLKGGYTCRAESSAPADQGMTVVDATWTVATMGIGLVNPALGVLSGTGQVVHKLAQQTSPSRDGSAMAYVKPLQQCYKRDGTPGPVLGEKDRRDDINSEPTQEKSWDLSLQHDGLKVGEQFTMWVELVSQVQAVAEAGEKEYRATAVWRQDPGEEGAVWIRMPNR